MGPDYGLADALVTAYFFRLDCIGLSRLWESRFARVTDWYARICERPSLATATAPWLDEAAIEEIRAVGRQTFLEDADFPDYL
jgi:glutathione S-transferase